MNMLNKIGLLCMIIGLGCSSATGDPTENSDDEETSTIDRTALLGDVDAWMYQIQQLDGDGAIETLAETDYDMLVVEPTHTNQGSEDFDVEGMVNDLSRKPDGSRRLVIAYIDIGEAEDYRTYWEDDWVAPTETERGNPDFLITIDPDGWSGNYPVAY